MTHLRSSLVAALDSLLGVRRRRRRRRRRSRGRRRENRRKLINGSLQAARGMLLWLMIAYLLAATMATD